MDMQWHGEEDNVKYNKKNIRKIKKEEEVQFIWVPRKKVQLLLFFFFWESKYN